MGDRWHVTWWLLGLALGLMNCVAASATPRTWHVPGDVETIGAAIDSCRNHPEDNIVVACGVYYEHEIHFGQTPIDLRSETGDPECVTIDARGLGSVLVFMDTPFDTFIEGFTFTGGKAHFGGGANLGVSNPTFNNCVFEGNQASSGGAIGAWKMSTPTFIDCEFVGNTAKGGNGGAIYCNSLGSPAMYGCVFRDNSALTGAAVMGGPVHTEITMFHCTLWNNVATAPAGAVIELAQDATLIMENCIVAFNSAGAAIHCPEQRIDLSLACNDFYGNPGGDWTGCVAEMLGSNGNFCADPLFCSELNPQELLNLTGDSPCAPENNPDCGLVGALPVGCSVTNVDELAPASAAAALIRVFPNPFNPRTSISFALEREEMVEIGIYDLSGGSVFVLADRTFPAGTHSLIWNGRNSAGRALPSGTYLVRLETESWVKSRKVMLVR